MPESSRPSILIMMPTKHIGDLLISMKTIETINQSGNYGRCLLVADDRYRSLLEMSASTTPTLFYPRSKLTTGSWLSRFRAFRQFTGELRSHKYDVAIDLDGTILSSRLTRLCKARHKIGPVFSKRPGVYQQLVDVDTVNEHKHCDYTSMLQPLGIDEPGSGYQQLHSPVDLPVLANKLQQPVLLNDNHRIACLHVGATKAYKQWGEEKFAALADQILEQGWLCIFIGAGEIDRSSIDDIVERMQHKSHSHLIDSCNRLNLQELVRLLEHTDIYIGNDSGPMHLSAATGTLTLGLFGPTDNRRWSPMGENTRVIRGSEPCASDCKRSFCSQNYRCMSSLSVENVLDYFPEQIQSAGGESLNPAP